MERCKQSVNVIKLSHLFTIWPPLPRPPSTPHPLSLLLSGPFYHSFKIVVALKPLANLSMSLFRAGQWSASQLPPGCRLIDGPLLGGWQAALVRHWCAGVTAAAAAAGGVSLCWGPQDLSARGLAQFAGARLEQLPGVLVVAELLVSSLQPVSPPQLGYSVCRARGVCRTLSWGFFLRAPLISSSYKILHIVLLLFCTALCAILFYLYVFCGVFHDFRTRVRGQNISFVVQIVKLLEANLWSLILGLINM